MTTRRVSYDQKLLYESYEIEHQKKNPSAQNSTSLESRVSAQPGDPQHAEAPPSTIRTTPTACRSVAVEETCLIIVGGGEISKFEINPTVLSRDADDLNGVDDIDYDGGHAAAAAASINVEALRLANTGNDELDDDDDDDASSHSMQLDCLPPAPLPPPPTSKTSYHLPLAAPTASLIASDGADDLDGEDPTPDRLCPPAPLPPTSRSLSPPSNSHQIQRRQHTTRTSRPPSRPTPTPTLPTMVAHSNRAAPLTRKLTISPNSDSTRSKAPAPASPTFPLPPAACAWLDLEWWWLVPFDCSSMPPRAPTIPPAPPLPGHSALTRPFLEPTRFIEFGGSTAQTEADWLAYSPRQILFTFDFNAHKLEIVIVGLSASKLKGRGFRHSQNRLVQYLELGSRAQITGATHTEPSNGGSILELEILSRLLLGFRPAVEDKIPVIDPRPKRSPSCFQPHHRGLNGDRLNEVNEHEGVALKSILTQHRNYAWVVQLAVQQAFEPRDFKTLLGPQRALEDEIRVVDPRFKRSPSCFQPHHRGLNGDRLNQVNEHERVVPNPSLKTSTPNLCSNSTRAFKTPCLGSGERDVEPRRQIYALVQQDFEPRDFKTFY
ncbi:hypothetical protein C8R46DRAFT_1209662 [Mycena filopes]|nr:hypothetical protein C8R46DRAFT_1209662 [Mycena filopes]